MTTEDMQHRIAALEAAQQRSEIISEINASLAQATTGQEILAAAAQLVKDYPGVAFLTLNYTDHDESGEVIALYNVALQDGQGQEIALGSLPQHYFTIAEFPLFSLALQEDATTLLIGDIQNDPRTVEGEMRSFCARVGIAALITIPLRTSAGWQGLIFFNWGEPQQFKNDIDIITQAIQPTACAVVATRRALDTQEQLITKRVRLSETTSELNASLAQAIEAQEILVAAAKLTHDYPGMSLATLNYTDHDEDNNPIAFYNVALQDGQGNEIPLGSLKQHYFTLEEFPIFDLLFEEGSPPLLMGDIQNDPRADKTMRDFCAYLNVAATIVIPLKTKAGWQGIIFYSWDKPQELDEDIHYLARAMQPTASAVVATRRILDTQEQVIAQRTRLLADITDNAPMPVVVKDLEGRFILANEMACKVMGANPATVVGTVDMDYFPPKVAQELHDADIEIAKQGKTIQIETTVPHPDGTMHTFLASKFPLFDAKGDAYATGIIANDITESRRMQQQLVEAQQKAIAELSTPIIPIMDRIIIIPLIGTIDSTRARDIMRALLSGITANRAKVVILDITGVALVDSEVAGYLNRAIQAARLKGSVTIVTGIADAVAETIVDLGIDWTAIQTLSDLQTGLAMAIRIAHDDNYQAGLRATANT